MTFQIRERPASHLRCLGEPTRPTSGGSGTVNWGDRDVFGNAEQFNVSASITGLGGSSTNGIGYDVPVKYILPDFGHRDQSLQFAVEAVKQDLIAYDQTALKAGMTLTRRLNRLWTVSGGRECDRGEHQSDQSATVMTPDPTAADPTIDR